MKYTESFQNSLWITQGKGERGIQKSIKQWKAWWDLSCSASKPAYIHTARLYSAPEMTSNMTSYFLSTCVALNKESKAMLAKSSFAQIFWEISEYLGTLENIPESAGDTAQQPRAWSLLQTPCTALSSQPQYGGSQPSIISVPEIQQNIQSAHTCQQDSHTHRI